MIAPRAPLPGLWTLVGASIAAMVYALWLGGDICVRWNYEYRDGRWATVPPPDPLWLRVAWGTVLLALAAALLAPASATIALNRPSRLSEAPGRWARSALLLLECAATLLFIAGISATFRAAFDLRDTLVSTRSPLTRHVLLVAIASIVPMVLAAVALGVHRRWRRLRA